MLCPVCKVELVMTERQHIEIDYCPQCRGVWLDRGELDKIIERSTTQESVRSAGKAHHGHRRKSWFEELFD
nr:zf-TFIIB domain-containing protein [Marinobacterium profundum]